MRVIVRRALKAATRGVAAILVLPSVVSFRMRSHLIGADRALEGSTQAWALMPGLTGQYLRRAFLAQAIAHCHYSAAVGFGTIFSAVAARIDEHAYVGPGCHLGFVHIEANAMLAAGVHVPSGARTHGTSDVTIPIRKQPGARTCVRIGAGAWIGSAAVVMADVGRDTVVGAGAVVTQPLPDCVIAAGVPARVLRHRRKAAASIGTWAGAR